MVIIMDEKDPVI